MSYPTTLGSFLTVAGVAFFGSAATQWLKRYLPNWRWTQLLVLGLCEVASLAAGWISTRGQLNGTNLFYVLMTGFWGATLACFGYEALSNWLGLLGLGKRCRDNS